MAIDWVREALGIRFGGMAEKNVGWCSDQGNSVGCRHQKSLVGRTGVGRCASAMVV